MFEALSNILRVAGVSEAMMDSSSVMMVIKSRKRDRLNITDPSLRIIVTNSSGCAGFFPFVLTLLESS